MRSTMWKLASVFATVVACKSHERHERAQVEPVLDADVALTVPEDVGAPVDFTALPAKIVEIAADPDRTTHDPITPSQDTATRVASVDVPGCNVPLFAWVKGMKDAWSFTASCPKLQPADLAPAGGLDVIDETYMVITSGPLAGVLVNRNIIDARIWTIATLKWRMRGDASMFVFCAEHRVPGRTFISPEAFTRQCTSSLEKRVGLTCAKYAPAEPTSGFDCGRSWKAHAMCERELFDENKVDHSFTCTYDSAKARVTFTLEK